MNFKSSTVKFNIPKIYTNPTKNKIANPINDETSYEDIDFSSFTELTEENIKYLPIIEFFENLKYKYKDSDKVGAISKASKIMGIVSTIKGDEKNSTSKWLDNLAKKRKDRNKKGDRFSLSGEESSDNYQLFNGSYGPKSRYGDGTLKQDFILTVKDMKDSASFVKENFNKAVSDQLNSGPSDDLKTWQKGLGKLFGKNPKTTLGKLAKNGKCAKMIMGDANYSAGSKLKGKNVSFISGTLWKVDNAVNKNLKDLGSVTTNGGLGSASIGLGHIESSNGHAEFDGIQAKAGITDDMYYANSHNNFGTSIELDALHAEANGSWEIGPDHVKASASAQVSVVHAEAALKDDFNYIMSDGTEIDIADFSMSGTADVLEADAAASMTAGFYKGEDGKLHLDAGIKLEANAELCSASGTVAMNVLGAGGSVTAKVKVGAGAQLNFGFQDGKFNFKIGAALGVGFELGFSYDVSGALSNLYKIADSKLDISSLKEDAKGWATKFWNDLTGNETETIITTTTTGTS